MSTEQQSNSPRDAKTLSRPIRSGNKAPSSNAATIQPKEVLIQIKEVSKTFGNHIALHDITLDVYHGEFLTLLGPSGCGKTTLLRMLAGFETIDTGMILLKGENISKQRPEERHLNMVFQNYALFPHMTIFDNIAFGLRCQKQPKEVIEQKVMGMLKRVGLAGLKDRKPPQLSGGQQQRIAIARALVNEPLVLLLDEPLSALDYHLRKQMQLELKALQRKLGMTFIMVTHDQEEALSLSDRVAVMNHGLIEQIGTPREVYEEPANLHVANFIGEANIIKTMVTDSNENTLSTTIENVPFVFKNKRNYAAGDAINIVVRPEDIEAWGQTEVRRDEDMLPGIVREVIYKGCTVDLMIELDSGKLVAATEFFNEDDEYLFYDIEEKVYIRWRPGWEVILPEEHK